MTQDEIKAKAESFGRWYHAIKLTPTYTTMSLPFEDLWERIAEVQATVYYSGKSVLDLGTMDGHWAFEAERRGARPVVAGDIWPNPRLAFAKEVFGSGIVMVPNADVHCLTDRIEPVMRQLGIRKFDVIQCMGVIYHVQNPILALQQIRNCIADDGLLLIEAGCWLSRSDQPTARLNRGEMLYDDGSTYWLMDLNCLTWILELAGFKVEEASIRRFTQQPRCERVCMICRPVERLTTADNYGARLL
jgi:tRNA (mo5U34)-methyltransferase